LPQKGGFICFFYKILRVKHFFSTFAAHLWAVKEIEATFQCQIFSLNTKSLEQKKVLQQPGHLVNEKLIHTKKHLMKRTFKLLVALFVAAFTTLPASAQYSEKDYEPYPYTFIGVQGGGQVTFSDCAFDKLITPIGAVSVGHFFTPSVGARLNVQGWNNKAGYSINGNDETYKFKYVTSNLDLMLNLTNIFSPHKYHTFNVILLGGVGLSYVWDNDEQKTLLAANNMTEPMAWEDNRLVHNFRVGLQFEVNVAKHLGVNLELQANNLHDRFNSKLQGKCDWQAAALVGLTYKFGFKKAKKETPAEPVQKVQEIKEEPKPEPVVETPPAPKEPEPEPVVVKEKEKTHVEVFFHINSTNPTEEEAAKVANLANWLKQHPDASVTLTGYADAGTGTASINRKLSEGRVNTIAKMLTEKHGISASRISTSYKGDTVQPFKSNDLNRAVVGDATE